MSRTHKDRPYNIRFSENNLKKSKTVDCDSHWTDETPSWFTNKYVHRPYRKHMKSIEHMIKNAEISDLDIIVVPEEPYHIYYH